jgi:hypothetical protein
MRFNFIHTCLLEIDDDTLSEYIEHCDKISEEYSVDGFIDFLNSYYYLSDFTQEESSCHDLKLEYLLDEIEEYKKHNQ